MAEDALTGPCSTGIPELNLVKFSLDYFPLLLRWHGTERSCGMDLGAEDGCVEGSRTISGAGV